MTEWLLIVGMMLVTFIPRYLPFALVDRLSLPEWFVRALAYVPIAVLTAIVAQNSFFVDGALMFSIENARLLTAVLAVCVAIFTKSLWWTVAIGIVFFALQSFFF